VWWIRALGGPARAALAAVSAGLVLWTGLLVHELPLASDHVELYADWDHHLIEAEVSVRSIRDGELPFWNPFMCGGLPNLGKPLSRIGTPFFLLHFLTEPSQALRWEIALHLLIAALGTALLVSRHVRGDPITRAAAALLGGMVYSGSSFFALHLTEGHLWMLTAAYLPLVLYCFERGVEQPRFAAITGILLALMLGEGGALPLPLAAVLLCFAAAILAVRDRSPRPLLALGIAGSIGVLLGAPKLLPLLDFIGRHPRETLDQLVFPVQAVLHGLLDRDQALRRSYDWLYWGWQEQGHYVGVFVVVLAAAGLALGTRIQRVYAGLALWFVLLAIGPFHALSPWSLLHRLPLLDALHVTSRFLVVTVLMLALLAAAGLGALLVRVPRPAARAGLAVLVVIGVAADLASVSHGIFGILADRPCPLRAWPADAPRGDPLIVTMRREPPSLRRCSVPGAFVRSAMVPAAREGVAIVRAYNALCPRDRRTDVVKAASLLRRARIPSDELRIRVPRDYGRKPGLVGVHDPGYRGESWLAGGEGHAKLLSRSMNRQRLEVATRGPARVVLNQNWDPGWRSDRGRLVTDRAGRLVIVLDEATHGLVRLAYRPPYWEEGLLCFGLGLLAVGAIWLRERKLDRPRLPGRISSRTPHGDSARDVDPDEERLAAPGPRG